MKISHDFNHILWSYPYCIFKHNNWWRHKLRHHRRSNTNL